MIEEQNNNSVQHKSGNKSKPLLSSRLLKFRLWDKRGQKFTTSGAYLSNTTLELDCIPDVKILQFTGLLDKNGVEIFEGDVVKSDWHWEDGKIVDLSYDGWFFYAIAEYALGDVLEVVGNIFENPELL